MGEQMQALTPDSDGKRRWYYELNLFANPTALITCMKVFGGIVLGMGVFIGLISDNEFVDKLKFILTFWLYGICGTVLLVGLSYVIYALIQGGKYCVIFEMDDKTVTHIQVAKQFKKAQVIGALTALTGAMQGSLTLMGTGILAGSRGSMQTKFNKVEKIKIKRRRNVIYLHSGMEWNQIYAERESFDEVMNFILEHIPKNVSGR